MSGKLNRGRFAWHLSRGPPILLCLRSAPAPQNRRSRALIAPPQLQRGWPPAADARSRNSLAPFARDENIREMNEPAIAYFSMEIAMNAAMPYFE